MKAGSQTANVSELCNSLSSVLNFDMQVCFFFNFVHNYLDLSIVRHCCGGYSYRIKTPREIQSFTDFSHTNL